MSALPVCTAFAQGAPLTEVIVNETFAPLVHEWQAQSGSWSVSDGAFVSSGGGPQDINTIVSYRAPDPQSPPTSKLQFDTFRLRVRMFNEGTGSVGVVYQYHDAENYHEVIVSADGSVFVRSGIRGGSSPHAGGSPVLPGGPVDLEVVWDQDRVLYIKGNGVELPIAHVFQTGFAGLSAGRIGLIAYGTTARFDDVRVEIASRDQWFLERFSDGVADGWMPQSGQWAVGGGGTYNNATVAATNVTLAPIHTEERRSTAYTLRARMLNPYGGSGNLVGIVFNYRSPSEYSELVFSPTGVARINSVVDRRRTTLATAPYGGRRNAWFDVQLENDFGVTVRVDGRTVFDDVPANPYDFALGGVGFITHWTPGRFDDVRFVHGTIRAEICLQTFSDSSQAFRILRGSWNKNGGTLNRAALAKFGIVEFFCRGGLDVTYHMKMRNEYGASGNLVGLMYQYQEHGDYYEAVFSTTGTVMLRKFIGGALTIVATGTHDVPAHEWFQVDLIRDGANTTVKVNGNTVIENVGQGELNTGDVGAITHWTLGHFDDVSTVQHGAK